MINEPFFEENIVSTIFRNFTFYFFGQTWYIYAVLLGISIYMAYRLLCKGSCTPCPDLFPSPAAGRNHALFMLFKFRTLLFVHHG